MSCSLPWNFFIFAMKIGIINGKGLVTAVSCMYIERYAFEIPFLQMSGTIRLMNLIDFFI